MAKDTGRARVSTDGGAKQARATQRDTNLANAQSAGRDALRGLGRDTNQPRPQRGIPGRRGVTRSRRG